MKDISYQTGRIIVETQFFLGNTTLCTLIHIYCFQNFLHKFMRLYVNSY